MDPSAQAAMRQQMRQARLAGRDILAERLWVRRLGDPPDSLALALGVRQHGFGMPQVIFRVQINACCLN